MARIGRFLAYALILGGIALNMPVGATEPILVIAAFNLTGPDSTLDVSAHNGARLAAEQINARGGVRGRPIELVTVETVVWTGGHKRRRRATRESNSGLAQLHHMSPGARLADIDEARALEVALQSHEAIAGR